MLKGESNLVEPYLVQKTHSEACFHPLVGHQREAYC